MYCSRHLIAIIFVEMIFVEMIFVEMIFVEVIFSGKPLKFEERNHFEVALLEVIAVGKCVNTTL